MRSACPENDLSQYAIRFGCFSEDARGRWYLSAVARATRVVKPAHQLAKDVGIDLGAKDLLATSDGIKVEAPPCEAVRDRDVNAARNILAAGSRRLAEGIPALAA